MLDLSKLSPAPWEAKRRYSNDHEIVPRIHCPKSPDRECGWVADLVGAPYLGYESTLVNAEFMALARNAFDIMMRRGWGCSHGPRGWWVNCQMEVCLKFGVNFKMEPFPDPFTALVEAEKWYVEHVENVEKQ